MRPPLPHADWAYRFAIELLRLGTKAEPDLLHDLGMDLLDQYPDKRRMTPESAVAEFVAEFGLPHDD